MTRTKSSKKFLIVLLIVLLLALAVGYAAFSDTLTIAGTASVSGSFDLQFADVGANGCQVLSQQGVTASVSVGADNENGGQTKDKLTVTVENLQYPGAGAEIQAVIKNVGTIPAKIKSVSATPTGNGNAIVINGLQQITTSHPVVQPNGTCTFTFTVMWDPNITTLDNTKDGENNNTYSFTLDIEYEQATTALNVTTTHSDANAVNGT